MYRKTILIIDDNEINRRILGNMLKEEYNILYADNGITGIKCINDNVNKLSAVILDMLMPVMNGYEVLKKLRYKNKFSHIPIIASSCKEGDETEIMALSLGARDFIAKPYNASIVKHRISNVINLCEAANTINKIERDSLTGLYNKECFVTKVKDILNNDEEGNYNILCFGIERFKLINETYGRNIGDKVLRLLANILKESCGEDNVCGRFNADQYYAITKHDGKYNNKDFKPWMDKIKNISLDLEIKIHCGIYEIIDKTIDVEGMCDRALLAANSNRGDYDNYFAYYDDKIREQLLKEQYILDGMQAALDEEQFEVYFQPKYDLKLEMIAGAEALVRWIHPEKGFMSPADFIPVFEKNGLITKLDRYVWEKTCKYIKDWKDAGNPLIAVSVNVSRADLNNPNLIDIFMELINKYEIPIKYFHLEVTESAYTNNPKQLIDTVKRLREVGFIVEMDDFGSGYSSLNMLSEMPIDILKLDMRFIQNEAENNSGKGIISFIINLAKWMNLAVVAEGVETIEQINFLRLMECNYVQGYYYAKPMNHNDFCNLLKKSQVVEMNCTGKNSVDYVVEQNIMKNESLKNMVIVEDEEINRMALASTFCNSFIVSEITSGKKALNYINQNYKNINIIILSAGLTDGNSFDILRQVKSNDETKNIPVIIMSTGKRWEEEEALKLEADDCVTRPYNDKILKHRVEHIVGISELKNIKDKMFEEKYKKYKNEHVQKDELLKEVEELKQYFDIVRLVDPKDTLVLDESNEDCNRKMCYSVWGKNARCKNCTSLRAFEEKGRATKLELSEDGLYYVISQYVPLNEYGEVLEIVSKVDEEYVDEVINKNSLYDNTDTEYLKKDKVTGVYTKQYLYNFFEKYKGNGENVNIAFIDIDNFEKINNMYGHLLGDKVLKDIANMLEANLVLGKDDFVTRFGGDEFLVVSFDLSKDEFSKKIVEIIRMVEGICKSNNDKYPISISVGCASSKEDVKVNITQLICIADKRLLKAKEKGCNQLVSLDD